MKIKILKFVSKEKTGMMVDLKPGEIIAVPDEIAKKLIDSDDAEYEI